jgi:hypothetical protein
MWRRLQVASLLDHRNAGVEIERCTAGAPSMSATAME